MDWKAILRGALQKYVSYAPAILAIATAIATILGGRTDEGARQLFDAILLLLAGGAAVGMAAGRGGDSAEAVKKVEDKADRALRAAGSRP